MRTALAVAGVNLLLPGVGTAVAAVAGQARGLLWKGAAQLLTALLIVGWVWALVTSAKVVGNAREAARMTRLELARPPAA